MLLLMLLLATLMLMLVAFLIAAATLANVAMMITLTMFAFFIAMFLAAALLLVAVFLVAIATTFTTTRATRPAKVFKSHTSAVWSLVIKQFCMRSDSTLVSSQLVSISSTDAHLFVYCVCVNGMFILEHFSH